MQNFVQYEFRGKRFKDILNEEGTWKVFALIGKEDILNAQSRRSNSNDETIWSMVQRACNSP